MNNSELISTKNLIFIAVLIGYISLFIYSSYPNYTPVHIKEYYISRDYLKNYSRLAEDRNNIKYLNVINAKLSRKDLIKIIESGTSFRMHLYDCDNPNIGQTMHTIYPQFEGVDMNDFQIMEIAKKSNEDAYISGSVPPVISNEYKNPCIKLIGFLYTGPYVKSNEVKIQF